MHTHRSTSTSSYEGFWSSKIAVVLLAVMLTAINLWISMSPRPTSRSPEPVLLASQGEETKDLTTVLWKGMRCQVLSAEYVASPYEREWLELVQKAGAWEATQYCKNLARYNGTIAHWLSMTATLMQGTENSILECTQEQAQTFSKFVTTLTCGGGPKSPSGSRVVSEAWIEPLMAGLRHPKALCPAVFGQAPDFSRDQETLHSRDYILLGSSNMPSYRKPPEHSSANSSNSTVTGLRSPHMNFLFDLGASIWNQGGGGDSQRWFTESYQRRGIEFDRILLWELSQNSDQHIFKDVPKELHQKYQYFNMPASSDPADPSNPLNMLKSLTRPSDYVVLKLDIDNNVVEDALMTQVLADKEIYSKIDEMFFEQHVNFSPMLQYWQFTASQTKFLDDSYRMYSRLRQLGIRMHGWT